ncbi:MAG: hypothetical protein ABFC62_04070 [Clostridiaceae bacterium]|nr:hypothetical protein [Eubacteriales bacterium]
MKASKILAFCIVTVLILAALSGCVPGDGKNSEAEPAGFFWGIWHGWIAPISLICSIFNKDIGIYEIHNNGFWYDLGYYMAIISGFGGIALSRRKGKVCSKGSD